MVEEPKKKKAKGFNTADPPSKNQLRLRELVNVARTSGEVMDIISGLVVLISNAICSENDTVNDNVW